jgi:hypothetical protein
MDKDLVAAVSVGAVVCFILVWLDDGCKKEGGMSGTWVSDPSGQAEAVRTLHLKQGGKITLKTVNNITSFHDEGTYWIEEGPPRKIIFKVKKSNSGRTDEHKKEFLILDDGNLEGYGDLILKKQ